MKYKKTLLAISSLLLAGAAFAGDAINVTIHNNTAQAYTFNDMGTN